MDSVGLLIFALALSSPAMATEAASVDIGEEIFDRWHIIPFEVRIKRLNKFNLVSNTYKSFRL